jgi:endonuclease/exonuclease/phosphatase family metal-dependent hydrolase
MPQPTFFRRLFLTLVAVAVASAGAMASAPAAAVKPTEADTAAEAFRVMSFNIRNSRAQDGANAWPKRTELIFATIAQYGPDLIGFQEVLADQYDMLVARLPEYGFSGVARDDGDRKGEWSCVAYRKDRFTVVRKGDFWLSETPTVIGSKSWDAALTRLCSWVRLREIGTDREYVFANTHFDHKGVIARQESSRVLSRELSEIARGVPAILVGDFNITEDNPAYTVLVRPSEPGALPWIDTYRALYPTRQPDESTFHGFKGGAAGSRIDFIFHTSHFRTTAAAIDRTEQNGLWPSDHYAVTATVKLETR